MAGSLLKEKKSDNKTQSRKFHFIN